MSTCQVVSYMLSINIQLSCTEMDMDMVLEMKMTNFQKRTDMIWWE
jgi:hypothetical protein